MKKVKKDKGNNIVLSQRSGRFKESNFIRRGDDSTGGPQYIGGVTVKRGYTPKDVTYDIDKRKGGSDTVISRRTNSKQDAIGSIKGSGITKAQIKKLGL